MVGIRDERIAVAEGEAGGLDEPVLPHGIQRVVLRSEPLQYVQHQKSDDAHPVRRALVNRISPVPGRHRLDIPRMAGRKVVGRMDSAQRTELGHDVLRNRPLVESRPAVAGDPPQGPGQFRLRYQASGSLGWSARSRLRMVIPGVVTRKPQAKRRLLGRRTALTVCQAINIAIDDGLADPGGELQRQPREIGIGLGIDLRQMVEGTTPRIAYGRHFGQPDHRLHRLDLAEEGAEPGEAMAAPVAEQPGGLPGHPQLRLRQRPPLVDGAADAVDDFGQVVLLASGGQASRPGIEDHFVLASPTLPRPRDRRDEGDSRR